MKTVRYRRSQGKASVCPACAFTVVEVAIVIFVIGILMAITLPLILTRRGRVGPVTCLNNLQQLHRAYAQYAQDYDGLIPPYQNSLLEKDGDRPPLQSAPQPRRLKAVLHAYASGNDEAIWHCPLDPDTRTGGVQDHVQSSYFTSQAVSKSIANGLMLNITGAPPRSQPTKVSSTHAALTAADASHRFLLGETVEGSSPTYTHGGQLHFLYFDGHLQAMPWKDAPR